MVSYNEGNMVFQQADPMWCVTCQNVRIPLGCECGMLVIDCCVPHLFYTDMVSHSLLSVAKTPRLGFAELHVRVKIGEVLFRCATTSVTVVV